MVDLVHKILDTTAERLPRKVAILTHQGVDTYGSLSKNSRHLAGYLSSMGVRRGDRVLIMLPNGIPAVTGLIAASRLGAIFFLLNDDVTSYRLRHILYDADPAIVITSARLAADHMDILKSREVFALEKDWNMALASGPELVRTTTISSDPVCLIYTSGSASTPKGVISTHGNVIFAVSGILDRLDIHESDVIGNFLPLSFDYGLYQLFLAFSLVEAFRLDDGKLCYRILARRQVFRSRIRDFSGTAEVTALLDGSVSDFLKPLPPSLRRSGADPDRQVPVGGLFA